LAEDDCAGAREEFEKHLELRPHNASTYTYLGLTDLCAEETSAAIEQFQTSMEMNPHLSFAKFGLGMAYMHEERYEDAKAQFQAAIEIDDDDAHYYLSLGRAHAQLGAYQEAETAYLQAVELKPEEVDPHVALGNFYLDRERLAEAEQQFEKALAIDEEAIQALIGAGVAYALQDRCGEALNVLNQAKELDPENFTANEVYNQCWQVYRYENPPGPQGEPINEGAAAAAIKNAVATRLGLDPELVLVQFETYEGARALAVGYLANFDANSQPDEFNNELTQAVFAAVDGFVRADSAPLYLSVDAFAIQGQDVVRQGGRVVHRTDAVDWWNGNLDDGAFMGKWISG
jgi:tetratricopeptide (TPR) repeat protein